MSEGAYFWCLHLSVSYMSSLLELVFTGVTSFFSPVAAEKDQEKKKKTKKRDHDDADLFDDLEMPSTPAPRQGRPRRDS